MKKIIFLVVTLGAVLVAAVIAAPFMVDQSTLRAWVAPQLQRALRQGVAIDGDIAFALLPQPMVRVEQVRLLRQDREIATVPTIEATLRLLPLLVGRLEPASLHLEQGTLTLPWGSQSLRVSPIDLTVVASDTETVMTGRAVLAQSAFRIEAKAGWQQDRLQRTEILLKREGGGELSWVGQGDPFSADQPATGKMAGKIGDLSQLADFLPAMPGVVAAEFALSPSAIDGHDLLLSIGDTDWRGKAHFAKGEVPRLEIGLHAASLSLTKRQSDEGGKSPVPLDAAPPAQSSPPAETPVVVDNETSIVADKQLLPRALSVDLSLSVDQILWRGKILQDAGLELLADNGDLTINQAHVTLPGNSEVSLFGVLTAGPALDGSFEAKSDDLRQLLSWCGADLPTVPADRLHVARLAGKIKARPDLINLDSSRLQLDSSQIDLAATIRPGPRPGVGLTFSIDSLNGDAYWPAHPSAVPTPPPSPPSSGTAPVATSNQEGPPAVPIDATVKGHIGRLNMRGIALKDVSLDGNWRTVAPPQLILSVPSLDLGKIRLDQAKMALTLASDRIVMDQFSAGLYGGQLTGDGSLTRDGGGLALHLSLAQAQMRQALLDVADIGLADGVMQGAVTLSSAGRTQAEIEAHLAGTASLSVTDGEIKGFDLKAADAKLAGQQGIGGLLAMLQAGLTGGSTHFSSLAGTAKIDQGVIVSDDLRLVAEGGGAVGAAIVNLPGDHVEAHADFTFAGARDAPPLVMRLTGSLESPHRFLDVKPLQDWLAQHGLKTGKPKDVLKGLLQGLTH